MSLILEGKNRPSIMLCYGDAVDILPSLESKAKCLVTDPPYRLISGGNTTGEMKGCFAKDRYDNSGSIVDCDIEFADWIPLLPHAMEAQSQGYIMVNNRHVASVQHEIEKAGFHFHNLLVWDKGKATPNRWYMKNCEFVIFFSQGKAYHVNNCGAKQLVRVHQKDVTNHPTEKPVSLMEHYIIQSTNLGDVVLDPFMGTGTTGVAAVKQDRCFIGIEKNRKWFDIACDRVREAWHSTQYSSCLI